MRTRKLSACLLAVCAALSLFSCRGEDKAAAEPEVQSAQEVRSVVTDENGIEWLIRIYKPTDMEIPANWMCSDAAPIDWDKANGAYRGLLYRMEEVEGEDGRIKAYYDTEIAVWDGEGKLTGVIPLIDPERRMLWRACFDGERLICTHSSLGSVEQSFCIFDTVTGKITAEMPVEEIAGWESEYGLREMVTDGAGNLYAGDGENVTVLSPAFVRIGSIRANTFDMARSPEGEVWAVCPGKAGEGRGLFRLDPEKGQKTELAPLDANAAHADGPEKAVSSRRSVRAG